MKHDSIIRKATVRMLRRQVEQDVVRHGPEVPFKVPGGLLLELCDEALCALRRAA